LQSLHAQSLTEIKNVFACSKHSNFKSGQSLFFSNVLFFYQMRTIHFENWRGFLTLMIRRAKGLELMKIVFITNLNTFGSKVFLTLKIMDFKSLALTKIIHIYVIEGMNA
jgi:hypothetical protein